ncbi:hypothetical protein GETHLI_25150 [Geothrix limicola]|uniref:DUF5808 domain-containing protein n=1 Tax=Geothrix limicola TaxID=2927978 RepID=A0ABQ5QHG9_9BACT|nr:DUF5808 domain-containing protein [Geothrix limicola]GLH74013.1 hypothetical protein GETHLI_25150 [Geothrix limicola]
MALALPSLMKGLPDPIPTHFDRLGHPNGWTPQAFYPWIAFGLPAFLWLLILLTGRAIVGTKQDPDGRKALAMAPLRGLMALGVLVLMAAVPLISRFGLGLMFWAMGLFLGLLILGTVLLVRKLKAEGPLDDPSHLYRWGLFYVNSEDPRIWVPKRIGIGWTLNFGHGLSWFLMFLLLLIPALLVGFALAH